MVLLFVNLPLPIFFSFVTVTAIVFYSYFYRKYRCYPDYSNVIPVISVSKSLEKICPISSVKKWKLLPIDYGSHRCWMNTLTLPAIKPTINLYGSSAVLKCSSANLASFIADVTRWPEWNPFHLSQYTVKSFHDKHLRRDHYMEAEQIISIIREPNKIQSHTSMYRFHDFTDNKVGWILFWNAKKLEFMFFLIQPVKNKNDAPQSVVTHIVGTESKDKKLFASAVLQRLRNIQDILSLSSLNLMPFKSSSSLEAQSEDSSFCDKMQSLSAATYENVFYLPSVRARKREVRYTEFILVPFISPLDIFWKDVLGFKLAVKNMDKAKSVALPNNSVCKQEKVLSKTNTTQKYPLRRTCSDFGIKSKTLNELNSLSKSISIRKDVSKSDSNPTELKGNTNVEKHKLDTSEDSETKSISKSKSELSVKEISLSRQKLRSFSETAIGDLEDSDISPHLSKTQHDYQNSIKLHDINENVEDNVLAIDDHKEMFNSSVSDFEIVEKCEFSENRIAAFMTQGNYGASELQAEVLLASQVEHDINSAGFQLSGGWIFHSNYKGMVVLHKATSSGFMKISSFLCQTEVPVAPKDVWKFVKNPQFRFICDESVKSVEVLEKISSSQKLIHTYHEVSGFLKKELVDFCLLQTERKELNKYYSCFYSIEFDGCPFMKSVIRGTLRPSGWIIEEIENDANKSKVTYMMQVLISSPDSLFIHDLATMVPQSVYNLKNYITSKPA